MMSKTASKCVPRHRRSKTRPYAQPIQNLARVIGRTVGQDQLAPGELGDRGPHRGVRLKWRMVDLMHIGEIIVGMYAMFGHHPAHRGAIAKVVVFLDPAGFLGCYAKKCADELADPCINLVPEIDVMRVQRVVEVEHPCVHVGKEAGSLFHRFLNRRPRESGDPYAATVLGRAMLVAFDLGSITGLVHIRSYGSMRSQGRRSWHRKP